MPAEPPVVVVGALLWRHGELLLGLRRADRDSWPGCWDLVGGHLEPGETPEQALVREVEEETGVTALDFHELATIALGAGDRSLTYHVYLVTRWSGEPAMRGEEHDELRWFAPDQACSVEPLASPHYPALFREAAARATGTRHVGGIELPEQVIPPRAPARSPGVPLRTARSRFQEHC